MITFLLVFSLILHAITFMLIIFLYRKLNTGMHDERQLRKAAREMEDLFNSYLLELKDENDKLIKMINKKGQETKKSGQNPKRDIPKPKSVETKGSSHSSKTHDHYQPETLVLDQQVQVDEPSYKTKALQMYKQGYTIEEIAQQLNKGKTEIELIVKFYTQS